MGSPVCQVRAYQPRRARASPLHRLISDEIESWVVALRGSPEPQEPDDEGRVMRGPDRRPEPCAEDSLRAFLGCGVHRFGVVRHRCDKCGDSLLVPYSCKRRLSCPSCDGKRSALGSAKATEELLPEVPYRQWVLVIPKRLRYFVHRDKRLPGELSSILATALKRHYARNAPKGAVPAQMHAIQRFGSRVNLHVHVHAVVSDGSFTLQDGVLKFHPAELLTVQELAELSRIIRRKILLRMRLLKAVPEEVLDELLARPLGGFSLDGSVRIEAEDRDGLARLVGYILRPAISVKRLTYKAAEGVVRYLPKKGHDGILDVVEFSPADFMAKFARLIPPRRAHLVRFHGALGPRSPMREAVTRAAAEKANFQLIREGLALVGVLGTAARRARAARKVVAAAVKGWAACLGRIFEIDVIKCTRCGGTMKAIASITDDAELERLLKHVGLEADFPRTRPARAPPAMFGGEGSQVDPATDAWDGKDAQPADD
ncbi:MAG: transposase [Elusimicrobia bacterium]|nr:transposase [Elusimicrobiota bacterium]